ncbi:MAG: hypothetical protein F6K35_26100 [Okeania sp. SIO2H7]|nr:hypothetical protein [Okeania sp. SIO2H7]
MPCRVYSNSRINEVHFLFGEQGTGRGRDGFILTKKTLISVSIRFSSQLSVKRSRKQLILLHDSNENAI